MMGLSALVGLFVAAFVAATVLPFQSEILFAGLQLARTAPIWALIVVASIGNTAGAFVNYALGRGIRRLEGSRFAIPAARMQRAQGWYDRWGVWTLLFSWAPLGDVLTVIAGAMRVPLWLFGMLVAVAKTARYLVLAALTAGLAG